MPPLKIQDPNHRFFLEIYSYSDHKYGDVYWGNGIMGNWIPICWKAVKNHEKPILPFSALLIAGPTFHQNPRSLWGHQVHNWHARFWNMDWYCSDICWQVIPESSNIRLISNHRKNPFLVARIVRNLLAVQPCSLMFIMWNLHCQSANALMFFVLFVQWFSCSVLQQDATRAASEL